MTNKKIIEKGITFDDVLLIPNYSEIMPRDVELKSKLTRDITLNIPLISAAMDSVTESGMSIAIARQGGIGVIHKNLSITRQAANVDRVKRSESGMIRNPVTLTAEKTLQDALDLMQEFSISGIPIINEQKILIGIITNRDLRFDPDPNDQIKNAMSTSPLHTCPVGTSLEEAEKLLQKYRIEKLPVVDANNILKGLITVKDIHKKKNYPSAAKDDLGRLRTAAAVGIAGDTLDRVGALADAGADVVFVDTAHAHTRGVIEMIKKIKSNHKDLNVVGGNIATADAAEALISAGVDGLKVGIGPGSICTTRIIAGVGVPQLSAIMNVASVASKHGIPVIADGGIKQTGDAAKAIAAGADTIMIGSMFAGHEESPGDKVHYEGRVYKNYRGMGSLSAMKKGSADRYFQDMDEEISKLVPEGIEGRVPYKGPVSDTINQITGGLKAAMGYCGCKTIDKMQEESRFIEMTAAGLKESHPHDVIITKESPNYFVK